MLANASISFSISGTGISIVKPKALVARRTFRGCTPLSVVSDFTALSLRSICFDKLSVK